MSYTLKLTNGKLLLTLPDQQSDSVSTSLTLIGKNVNAYGTDINQNYIHILENFANGTSPNAPLIGQLWYDTNAQILKVYTRNNEFKSVGAPVIASVEPITLGVGEFWYDTTSEQMKFKADASTLVTVGPQFDATVGKSGWVTETVVDTANNSQTVVSFYSNDVLMGVLTNKVVDVRVDYTTATAGLSTLNIGFNAVSTSTYETKWHGRATKAETLIDNVTGAQLYASQFLRDNGVPISIQSSPVGIYNSFYVGHMVGSVPTNDFLFTYTPGPTADALFQVGGTNQNLRINVNSNAPYSLKGPAIFVDGTYNRVGFFNTAPSYDVDVKGDMRVNGNLIVNGSSTFITSQDLVIIDKTITLGQTTTPDDNTADGGGIILRSLSRDKEIKWITTATNFGYGVDNSWSITDNVELRFVDSAFYIYGQKVLDRTSLGTQVTSAPGLVEIGSLTSLEVGTIAITSASNTTTIGASVAFPNTTISIGNAGTKEVTFVNAPKVTAPYPIDELDEQVATVKFVNDALTSSRNKTMSVSIDVTGKANTKDDPNLDLFVQEMLTFLWDPGDPDVNYRAPETARARVICIRYQTIQIDDVASAYMTPGVPLYVDKDGITSSVAAMAWSEYYRVTTTLPASDLTIERVVKEYEVYGGVWRPKDGFGGLLNIVSSTSTVHTNSGWYWDNP